MPAPESIVSGPGAGSSLDRRGETAVRRRAAERKAENNHRARAPRRRTEDMGVLLLPYLGASRAREVRGGGEVVLAAGEVKGVLETSATKRSWPVTFFL